MLCRVRVLGGGFGQGRRCAGVLFRSGIALRKA